MWLSTMCQGCGYQCWKLTDPSTVKAGWLSMAKCTCCGRPDVVVMEKEPEDVKPAPTWLKLALVEAGLDVLD